MKRKKALSSLYRYTYDDILNPNNNCVMVTMVRVSEKCGLAKSTVRGIFQRKSIYYDPDGKFRIEKRPYEQAKSKRRYKI